MRLLPDPEEVPTIDLATWAAAAGVGRSLAYHLASNGEIDGLMRFGGRYRVATAVARRSLGLTESDPGGCRPRDHDDKTTPSPAMSSKETEPHGEQ